MKASRYILSVGIAVALPLGWVVPAQAQRGIRRARVQQLRRLPVGQRVGRGQIPRNWMERLQQMTPEQQERFLKNNRRFRNLPPKQQALIRTRLKEWNSLTPAQRRTLIRRARIFESMSPQERREIRQVILPEWRRLPPGRRKLLVRKLQQLQRLSDSRRKARLKNPQFVRGLSPKERDLLKKLSQLRVNSGAGNL